MDALILSCGTGGGHNAAGYAVQEALERAGHRATMMNPYDLKSTTLSRRIDRTYITLAQRAPVGFGAAYRAGDMVRRLPGRSPVYAANCAMADRLRVYLDHHPVDVIFMPHLFPAEILTRLRRKGVPLPRLVFIATDYVCIPFTEETECDAYVIPSPAFRAEFAAWGIPEGKLYPLGIPVKKAFSEKPDRAALRASLGLSTEGRYVLLSGGSMGAGRLETVIDRLLSASRERGLPVTPIVICGNNDRLYDRVQARHGDAVRLLHTTDRMADYLHAVDLYMTKPGGLSSTEAAVAGVPLVHLPPIPGCETVNARYFSAMGMSRRLGASHGDVTEALALLSDPAACAAMVAAQAAIPTDAADRIVETFCAG